MKLRWLFSIVLMAGVGYAQAPPAMPKGAPLWAGEAPGAQGTAETDIPTLAPYLVAAGRGTGTGWGGMGCTRSCRTRPAGQMGGAASWAGASPCPARRYCRFVAALRWGLIPSRR